MNAKLESMGITRREYSVDNRPEWFGIIEAWKQQYPLCYEKKETEIAPQQAIEELYNKLKDQEAIICTGVGQHQMFAAQFYKFQQPRRLSTSGGLGSMGYGLPAAMGAHMAYPDKPVVNIDGDGSFLMNVQELATIRVEKMPIKCMILDNQHLGMVVQWEDLKYDSNRAQTFLAEAGLSEHIKIFMYYNWSTFTDAVSKVGNDCLYDVNYDIYSVGSTIQTMVDDAIAAGA
jgi:acetolactate synthase-1/2/3 large subunit